MQRLEFIENYARKLLTSDQAHDFKHVQRVRSWATFIGHAEKFENLELLEVAALLHDIGLASAHNRMEHGVIGAQMAARFLEKHELYHLPDRDNVVHAIRFHNTKLKSRSRLLNLLRDADMMDLFGAVGIMRAYTSKSMLPEYDPHNIKGETWNVDNSFFDERITKTGSTGAYIIDQINFQISCFQNLHTATARQQAQPLIEFMRHYILQLEQEIVRF